MHPLLPQDFVCVYQAKKSCVWKAIRKDSGAVLILKGYKRDALLRGDEEKVSTAPSSAEYVLLCSLVRGVALCM